MRIILAIALYVSFVFIGCEETKSVGINSKDLPGTPTEVIRGNPSFKPPVNNLPGPLSTDPSKNNPPGPAPLSLSNKPPGGAPIVPSRPHISLPAQVAGAVIGPRCAADGSFDERLYVQGEGGIPAEVMVEIISPEDIRALATNEVGQWVDDLINERAAGRDIVPILAQAMVRDPLVDYKRFWHASKGPEFLEYVSVSGVVDPQVACGGARGGRDTSLNCFSLMTLMTNLPIPDNMKLRHVAQDLGLDAFCRDNEAGLVAELGNNANNPNGWINARATEAEKKIEYYRNGFAANWLSFCPNLIEASTKEIRKMVFDHAIYRRKVEVGAEAGFGIEVEVRNRTTTFTERITSLLQSTIADLMKSVGRVRFGGELGIGPGVVTNWYEEMSKQIFSIDLGIFEHSDNLKYVSLKKNVLRVAQADGNLQEMKNRLRAAGRFFGHAIVNGRYIASDMTFMFIAKLVGKVIGFEALSSYAPQEYNFYQTVHNNAGSDSGIPIPEFLDPSGQMNDEWPESQEGRDRMLDWYVSNYANAYTAAEFAELVGGLFDVIPKSVFESGIKVKELHEVMFGAATVDLDDMFANWDISAFRNNNHPQIAMLKAVLRGWESNPDRGQAYLRRFVDFVTGSSRVVAGGFGGYQAARGYHFTVIQRFGSDNGLPISHNCWNRLDLPTYTTQARMEDRLIVAIFGANGFGIV